MGPQLTNTVVSPLYPLYPDEETEAQSGELVQNLDYLLGLLPIVPVWWDGAKAKQGSWPEDTGQ